MIGILIMMNDYSHDFATAIFLNCTFFMFVLTKYVEDKGAEAKGLVVGIYPKMLHVNAGAAIFLFMAGTVRAFTFKEFEWANAVGNNQVPAIIVKHILMFAMFFYSVYIWIRVHKKIQALRKELGISR